MSWKGLSDYPSNFEYKFEGDSVGRFGRYPALRIRHRGDPMVTNMDEEKGSEVNGNESSMSLTNLLSEGIKGFLWGPAGIQIGVGLTIIIVSKVMGYW